MNRVSKDVLSKLLEENDIRLKQKVEQCLMLKNSGQDILLVMDFDECATAQHLSRLVTESLQHRSSVSEEDKHDNSISGIARLFNCYAGLTNLEFLQQVESLAIGVNWKDSFLSVAPEILFNKRVFPVFISSGLYDAARLALKSRGLEGFHILADEVEFDNGILVGPYTIVGDKEKGDIVRQMTKKGHFGRCVTVGHSRGDVFLIKAGSRNYRLSLRDKAEAMAAADFVIDDWRGLLEYLS